MVNVQSDHRPLESIFKKAIGDVTSPRLQRMLLKLQRYQLLVGFTPGKEMYMADTLSRAYLTTPTPEDQDFCDEMEVMVHTIVTNIPMAAKGMQDIGEAAARDPDMQKLKSIIIDGWPHHKANTDPELAHYWAIREELCIAEGLVLYGNRIVIPASLRGGMLHLLHESHQGTEKSKARARTIMYWPGISRAIEEKVARCPVCLHHLSQNTKEPLKQHQVPELPWQNVASDIMYYKGKDYLIVVDMFSKYAEIMNLTSKTAAATRSCHNQQDESFVRQAWHTRDHHE
jgi:hypothetical protein